MTALPSLSLSETIFSSFFMILIFKINNQWRKPPYDGLMTFLLNNISILDWKQGSKHETFFSFSKEKKYSSFLRVLCPRFKYFPYFRFYFIFHFIFYRMTFHWLESLILVISRSKTSVENIQHFFPRLMIIFFSFLRK